MDAGKAISISEVSGLTGIHENTLRRYAKTFRTYLPANTTGKVTRYQPEALDAFRLIYDLYQQGYGRDDIEAQLRGRFNRVVDLAPMPTADDHQAPPPSTTEASQSQNLPAALGEVFLTIREETKELSIKMDVLAEELIAIRQTLAAERQEKAELLERLARLEADQAKGHGFLTWLWRKLFLKTNEKPGLISTTSNKSQTK